MFTAVIAEDQDMLREALREHLLAVWPELTIVAEAEDGLDALAQVNLYKPSVIFLDINMPKLTGLEVANAITGDTHIVFITSHEDFALQAFEANAVDYIVKPVEISRLSKVVLKLKNRLRLASLNIENENTQNTLRSSPNHDKAQIKWLRISVGQQVKIIEAEKVYYFESDTKYTRVVAQGFSGLIRTTIKELEKLLHEDFIMAHRGVLVNRRFIEAVIKKNEQMEIELANNMGRLKISLSNQHFFKSM